MRTVAQARRAVTKEFEIVRCQPTTRALSSRNLSLRAFNAKAHLSRLCPAAFRSSPDLSL